MKDGFIEGWLVGGEEMMRLLAQLSDLNIRHDILVLGERSRLKCWAGVLLIVLGWSRNHDIIWRVGELVWIGVVLISGRLLGGGCWEWYGYLQINVGRYSLLALGYYNVTDVMFTMNVLFIDIESFFWSNVSCVILWLKNHYFIQSWVFLTYDK